MAVVTGWQYLRARQGEHSLILLADSEFDTLIKSRSIALPDRHAEHFARVLRRAGVWNAFAGNGRDSLLEAVVEKGEIRLEKAGAAQPLRLPERKVSVTIAQAWVKPKSLSLVLQKCAELGVDEIILFDCRYSATHSEKPQRMDAILENACMQAYNPIKPVLRLAKDLAALRQDGHRNYFGDPRSETWLTPQVRAEGASRFICGPEGGFTEEEMAVLRSFASGVLISENVLRAETAAIIAAGILCLGK